MNAVDGLNEWLERGRRSQDAGRINEAYGCYVEAVKRQPRTFEQWAELGLRFQQIGRAREAASAYQRALQLNGSASGVRNNLGVLYMGAGRLDEAENQFRQVLSLEAHNVDALFNLGVVLAGSGRREEAWTLNEQVIGLKPDYAPAWYNRGIYAQEDGDLESAEKDFRHALQLRPDYPNAINNLGGCLQAQERLEEAAEFYRRLLELAPGFATAWYNLALVEGLLNHLEESRLCLRRALASRKDYDDARWELALLELKLGHLERGWLDYELRIGRRGKQRRLPFPLWSGEALVDKTILVNTEQGIGDEVMFASCLPDLQKVARHCVIECDGRLTPLFGRSFPHMTVVGRGHGESEQDWLARLPPVDVRIDAGSLPRYFRKSWNAFPHQQAYLQADATQVDIWRQRYAVLGDGLKIGISWRGGKDEKIRQRRSIPLPEWAPALSGQDAVFVSLQYNVDRDEIERCRQQTGVTVHVFEDCDPWWELDGFAAQIAALDRVVSVDNSTVHLAGALGVPTLVLLPFAADWRWFANRDDSPWYPGVTLLHQQQRGDWRSVLERVPAWLPHASMHGR